MAGADISTCLELALEGERLCKSGDCLSGIAFFEAAIQAGCDDLRTLSAIYSQLGNAYFYMGDYAKAMSYHKLDLTVARSMGDKLGEAKASGNLGNTLKVMGKFDEAILCCSRHLEITTKLNDKIGQARAYYNLGNAYHAKGKHTGRIGQNDPGEFPDDVKECLIKALENYQSNLELCRELNDRSGEGRACGNLGNVHYLLGDFDEAIVYHDKRLEIAREFGDKNAQRRAYTNLGNAHVFSGNFETAAQHYKKSLLVSQELGDKAVEAQACFSLGNTYTLLRDYSKAVEYHLKHLQIAQQLHDKIGEGRAYWSLGNAFSSKGDLRQALSYAQQHLRISKELDDPVTQETAELNVADIRKQLGVMEGAQVDEDKDSTSGVSLRRKSMEEMSLIRMTPEAALSHRASTSKNIGSNTSTSGFRKNRSQSVGQVLFKGNSQSAASSSSGSKLSRNLLNISKTSEAEDEEEVDQDAFFDLLTKCQAERMDDQRCVLPTTGTTASNSSAGGSTSTIGSGNLATSGLKSSTSRPPLVSKGSLNYQEHSNNGRLIENKEKRSRTMPARANSVPAPVHQSQSKPKGPKEAAASDDLLDMIWGMQSKRMDEQRASLPESTCLDEDEDKFFDLLIRTQSSRFEDQRSVLPEDGQSSFSASRKSKGPTVPDEDFFTLIARLQEGRMDDQRADIKDKNRNKIN